MAYYFRVGNHFKSCNSRIKKKKNDIFVNFASRFPDFGRSATNSFRFNFEFFSSHFKECRNLHNEVVTITLYTCYILQ